MLAFEKSGINVTAQEQRAKLTWLLWIVVILGVAFATSLIMLRGTPSLAAIGWLLFLIGAAIIIYKPRYGVYLTLFLALVGDALLTPWYPFNKGLSSPESLLYLYNALIISPLEIYLLLTFISWLGRGAMQRKIQFHASQLLWPILIFLIFVTIGLAYGLGRGGDATIALWESRPIFHMAAIFVLASNLLTRREHVSHLMWFIMVALFIEGLVGAHHYFFVLKRDLSSIYFITEHAAAIHMNTLFVFALAVWLFRGSLTKRILLPLMVPPVLLTYLATQRRAAYISLLIALVFMSIILYRKSRKAFWLIVPPIILAGMLYLGVYWNRSGALGKPAQAVKSVLAEDELYGRDRQSNVYRQIENVNVGFTIRQNPLTGVGFGQKFFVIIPMADISFFTWWQYLPHNSIMWVWLKTGIGGFLTMLVLVGLSLILGLRVFKRMPDGDLRAISLTATLYLVMHFIYAYVDLSWDSQSTLYVGAMMGIIASLERIVAQPVPLPAKRWPWQPDPQPAPKLRPITGE